VHLIDLIKYLSRTNIKSSIISYHREVLSCEYLLDLYLNRERHRDEADLATVLASSQFTLGLLTEADKLGSLGWEVKVEFVLIQLYVLIHDVIFAALDNVYHIKSLLIRCYRQLSD
jgi:hypothetical protein